MGRQITRQHVQRSVSPRRTTKIGSPSHADVVYDLQPDRLVVHTVADGKPVLTVSVALDALI